MLLSGKRLQDIDEDDLLSLIGTEESRTIDFKKSVYQPPPPGTNVTPEIKDKWRRDLCTDVSAFANANGGWIICGIEDKDGVAAKLCGLGAINPDDEILRLEQCIHSGIEPKIPGLQIQKIDLPKTGAGSAIVIYVPQSFVKPHRVKETSKFHIRRSRGNDEMDLAELRDAFNLSESYIERIKNFRRQRVEAIESDVLDIIPVNLEVGLRIVLHIIPFAAFSSSSQVDLSGFNERRIAKWLFENNLHSYVSFGRFNFDGFMRPYGKGKSSFRGYKQIFRNGAVEFTETLQIPENKRIDLFSIESIVLDYMTEATTVQQNLGVELPLVVMLSIVGVKDVQLNAMNHGFPRYDADEIFPIAQDKILLPDVVFEDYNQNPQKVIKPAFDVLWNVVGKPGSRSYNANGEWIRQNR